MTEKKTTTMSSRAPLSQRNLEVDFSNRQSIGHDQIRVVVDGNEIFVSPGTTILDAAHKIGVPIPTLCSHEDLCVVGNCRICVVEVEGQSVLQAACAYPITEPIAIRTQSRTIHKARRHIVDLMLARHHGECFSCRRNLHCELQALAKEYGVDTLRFRKSKEPVYEEDHSSYSVIRDMNKCVLCRRCVRACIDMQEVGVMEAIGKGEQIRISTFLHKPLRDVVCISCGQCVARCPTDALRANDNTDEIWEAIDDPSKHVVIQVAPSTRASIGEIFGREPGTLMANELNTALRSCGFDRVFDTNFAADAMVIEQVSYLLQKLHCVERENKDASSVFPIFSSCCSGWVRYLEHFFPDRLSHLATTKSPQQILGALLKTFYANENNLDPADIVSVALMPCSAKKYECNRPEMASSGFKDVDFGLTTREMGKLICEAGIDLNGLAGGKHEMPFQAGSDGTVLGASSGVASAVMHRVLETVYGKPIEDIRDYVDFAPVWDMDEVRYGEIKLSQTADVPTYLKSHMESFDWLQDKTLKIGTCKGTANAKRVLIDIEQGGIFSECHFIEFLACPGGCYGGGGQPRPTSESIRHARANAISMESVRNRTDKDSFSLAAFALFETYFKEGIGGKESKKLLHTSYTKRGKFIS